MKLATHRCQSNYTDRSEGWKAVVVPGEERKPALRGRAKGQQPCSSSRPQPAAEKQQSGSLKQDPGSSKMDRFQVFEKASDSCGEDENSHSP